jgi:hypothetical protein
VAKSTKRGKDKTTKELRPRGGRGWITVRRKDACHILEMHKAHIVPLVNLALVVDHCKELVVI